jgi:hypothetical protein
MSRFATLSVVLGTALLGLGASLPFARTTAHFPVNSTIAAFFHHESRMAPQSLEILPDADTTASTRVLLFNYAAYDSAYAHKMHRFVEREIPRAPLTDFWDGSANELKTALSDQDAVVIAYPAGGNPTQLRAYGQVLDQFVRAGGTAIIAGTHEYSVLQQLGLFSVDSAYFLPDPAVHNAKSGHDLMAGIAADFSLSNYGYVLSVSDPAFASLAEVDGQPIVGCKNLGEGRVIYIGFEYYSNEAAAQRILANALRMAAPTEMTAPVATNSSVVRRTEQVLYSGGNKSPKVNLKIYPNPYFEKAGLEFELTKPTATAIEMTDETGRLVANLLPLRTLSAGSYRFELPNVKPGIYFVQCKIGDRTEARRVVKLAQQ